MPHPTDTDTTAKKVAAAAALLPQQRFTPGLVWSLAIAALCTIAGSVSGAWVWSAVTDDNPAPTRQNPGTVTIEQLYEDGSGTFRSGTRTLSDGQVIKLDGEVFCLADYGCSD